MKRFNRIIALLLVFAMVLTLAGCKKKEQEQVPPKEQIQQQEQSTSSAVQQPQEQTQPQQPENNQNQSQAPPSSSDQKEPPVNDTVDWPDKNGYYYDVENVVLYLHKYGKLPSNYIKKAEAEKLGWEGGSVEKYKTGAAIGGDNFGNREGLLPKANGRKFTECDIDTKGAKSRGAKRLIFSNDGLYFYTDNHYESFTELTVDENNKIVWK